MCGRALQRLVQQFADKFIVEKLANSQSFQRLAVKSVDAARQVQGVATATLKEVRVLRRAAAQAASRTKQCLGKRRLFLGLRQCVSPLMMARVQSKAALGKIKDEIERESKKIDRR